MKETNDGSACRHSAPASAAGAGSHVSRTKTTVSVEALSNHPCEPLKRRRRGLRSSVTAFIRRWREYDLHKLSVGIGRVLLWPFPDSVYLRLGYRVFFGTWPDYRHPRSFNEHIHEYMLRCRDPMLSIPADKIESRHYIAERVGADVLVPLLGVWDRPEDVPLSTLPRPLVLKPTAASGLVLIVRAEDELNEDEVRDQMRRWLRRCYSQVNREWCYRGVPRRLMAETMLSDDCGGLPPDHKAYVIGGKVRFLQVDRGRFDQHTRNVYDPQWNPLPARWTLQNHEPDLCPACLPRMIELAEILAEPFEFLRVDFYVIGQQLYIGELTNYPGAGFERFIPSDYAWEIGKFWTGRPRSEDR
ncbi:ATP-grasp fold amidoligase family protein [Stieleria sp.]|uniref:ATP-grasp fold amidoligase family protein n=1 Tax=Stieleria sp. TaxID=2795976 RepID=UPI0035634000